ncbi:unnamed protein product [Rangifer tarandus platyrhynchus]|uniref:Uncharacterized protein n=2 Tax=Rangifer tarandus platyrhynchus TaxID=3082113 RepID=A0AC59ZRL0_RANTA|nr:unnamed protein product [Rangifer tarandus platyrhynchus]
MDQSGGRMRPRMRCPEARPPQVLVAACGIKFLHQQLNPAPLHWEHGVLATGPPAKPQNLHFKIFVIPAHCHSRQQYSFVIPDDFHLHTNHLSTSQFTHHHLTAGDLWIEGTQVQHTHTHTHTHTNPYQQPHPWTVRHLTPPPTLLQIGTHSFEGISQL